MDEIILIAGADADEVATLGKVLSSEFIVDTLVAPARLLVNPKKYRFILLDQNFTEFHSLDMLMHVLNDNRIPVMVLARTNSARDVIEALNMGASDFLVKQGDYAQMLVLKVRNAIDTFNETRKLREQTLALKAQVKDLEEQLALASLHDSSYVVRDGSILRLKRQ
jgi:DNA-binding NtrC family response regulator